MIEMMVVIVIIGILLTIAVARFQLMIDRTREKTTFVNLRNIKIAVMMYADTPAGFLYGKSVEWFENALTIRFTNGKYPPALLRSAAKNNQSNALYCGAFPTTDDGGWMLSTQGMDGRVYINSTGLSTAGVPYSIYEMF